VVDDSRQVGVAQRGQQPSLALELALRFRPVIAVLFERHRHVEGQMPGAMTAPKPP